MAVPKITETRCRDGSVQAKYFLLARTPTKATVTADFSFLMFVLSNKC